MSYPNVNPAPLGDTLNPALSSGSDQSKSHIGPSWGISWALSNCLILSKVSIDGESPWNKLLLLNNN